MILTLQILNFLSLKNIIVRLNKKVAFALIYIVYCYCCLLYIVKCDLVYPVYVSDEKFEKHMDLLLITDECKSCCIYIKDFKKFMCNKTKIRIKKHIIFNALVVKKSQ